MYLCLVVIIFLILSKKKVSLYFDILTVSSAVAK